ncbi:MAG: PAS domain S-box protein [Deltaproteobacteria bacterium]|nr:PAS domain S-box protein [Deltaproteobacteria bacterium]
MANEINWEKKHQRANQKIVVLEKLIEDSTRELYIAQENLISVNSYLNSIITSMIDMLIIVDGSGKIKMTNQATLNLLHYFDVTLNEKDIGFIIPQNWAEFNKALLHSGSKVQEMQWVSKDREQIHVLVSGSVIRNDQGNVLSFVLLGRDMREYKKIQNQLMHSNKMTALGELFGYVAHELNTPLGTLFLQGKFLLDLFKKIPVNTAQTTEIVTNMLQITERIAAIVRELNSFVREGGSDPFVQKHIKAVVLSTLAFCGDRYKMAGVNIQVNIDENDADLTLECRPTQLTQVLFNLFQNSSDAIENLPEKWIKISAKSFNERIELSIVDSGNGIPELIRGKIFDPFFTTKELGKGTGIGLNVSGKLIEAHGGTISLDPTNNNTCFVLSLPKKQNAL